MALLVSEGAVAGRGWPEDPWVRPVGSDGVCGRLADGYHFHKTFGGQPKPVAAFTGVTGGWYPPAEGRMSQGGPAFRVANPRICSGPSLGEFSGGNWMDIGRLRRLIANEVCSVRVGATALPPII